MLILTQTDVIKMVLAGNITTNQLQCYSTYRDITAAGFTPGRKPINSNNITNVDMVDAPAAATSRVVDYLSIYNNDTANATVTIMFDVSDTIYKLIVCTLAPGEKIEYQEGNGFKVITNSGAVKNSLNQGNNATSSALSTVVLGADVINNNAVANTIADVTGLSFPVTANTRYYFRFIIRYTAAATTTGSRWSINGPTNNELSFKSEYSLTATTITINEGLSTYDTPASANATSATTASNIAIIEGFIRPTANGTVIARFASEVLSSAITAKAGSVLYYQAI